MNLTMRPDDPFSLRGVRRSLRNVRKVRLSFWSRMYAGEILNHLLEVMPKVTSLHLSVGGCGDPQARPTQDMQIPGSIPAWGICLPSGPSTEAVQHQGTGDVK